MAGLSGAAYLFLNVSGGRLINKQKQISFFGYEGTLIGLKQIMDEFDGKQISKIKLLMKDAKTDEIAQISFTEESWFSQGFFSRIGAIDLSKPFVLGVSGSDVNEKVSFCWMKQFNNKIEHDKDFPRPITNARGKQNYDEMIEATTKLMETLTKKVEELNPPTAGEGHAEVAIRPEAQALAKAGTTAEATKKAVDRSKSKAAQKTHVTGSGLSGDPDLDAGIKKQTQDLPF